MGDSKRPEIRSLTGIRFVAAMAVLFVHFRPYLRLPHVLFNAFSQGAAGVSFFFILSGFVLYYNYHHWFQGTVSADKFYEFAKARFARIYPMYVVGLAFVTTVVLVGEGRHLVWQAAEGKLAQAGSWLANLTLLQVWIPTKAVEDTWNGPAWSLANEMFFYALLPAFIAFVIGPVLRRRGGASWLVIGILGLEFMSALAAYLLSKGIPGWPSAVDFLLYRFPLVRVWEFFLGAALGAIHVASSESLQGHTFGHLLRNRLWVRNAALAFALAATTPFLLLPEGYLTVPRWFLAYTPMFSLIVLSLASGRTFLSPVLESSLMRVLGQASYSLYILHWGGIIALQAATKSGVAIQPWMATLMMLGFVAASVLCMKTIETPARRAIRSWSFLVPLRSAPSDPA